MEIVINDTNILVDLFNAGLLECCKQLNLEFRTIDLIIDEIEVYSQREAVEKLIEEGTLKVYSLTGAQVATVFEKINAYQGICNLSPQDISVMVYALENGFRLLTGDKTLRNKAILENVTVSGILYLTDMITRDGILSPQQMIHSLELLLKSNERLPKKLINERIAQLKNLE